MLLKYQIQLYGIKRFRCELYRKISKNYKQQIKIKNIKKGG